MANYKIKGLAGNDSPYRIKGLAEQSTQESPMQQTQEGVGSIPSDIGNAGFNFLMGAGEKAMQLPEEIASAGQQLAENPVSGTARAGGSLLSSLLEGGKGLYNLPLNINTYLGSKGVFPFKQTMPLAEKLKIGETGLQKAVMGEQKPGDVLFSDIGSVAPLFFAPESISSKVPALTSKGLMKQLSKGKQKELSIAKKEYSDLFNEAHSRKVTHALPLKSITKNEHEIVKNSQPKYHTSLKKYLNDPTIENAHWAQSELGSLKRHLDRISQRNGLTPSQVKTYKAVDEAQKGIKKSMFSDNALAKHPDLALKYTDLAKKYRENVIPYTSLEDLSEFEAGKLRPKTAVKNLLNDEEFMINLSKKYPGIFLHTSLAKKAGLGGLGLLGYDELKKLMHQV